MHMFRSLQSQIFEILLSRRQKTIKRVIYLTTIHDNDTMADHFLIAASEVYVVNPTEESAEMTAGGGGTQKSNRKTGKSTSKKSKFSNDDES